MMEKIECLKVLCFVDWKGDVRVKKESSADTGIIMSRPNKTFIQETYCLGQAN